MSAARVREALAWLERKGTRAQRDGLARYGITAPRAFGVKMAAIQQLARQLGRDHDLALALWDTGWYEARLLTAYVDEPERVTSAQMDRWVRAFDIWAVCDTLCFSLWDRTPLAWKKIEQWRARREEFGSSCRDGITTVPDTCGLLVQEAIAHRGSPPMLRNGLLPCARCSRSDCNWQSIGRRVNCWPHTDSATFSVEHPD